MSPSQRCPRENTMTLASNCQGNNRAGATERIFRFVARPPMKPEGRFQEVEPSVCHELVAYRNSRIHPPIRLLLRGRCSVSAPKRKLWAVSFGPLVPVLSYPDGSVSFFLKLLTIHDLVHVCFADELHGAVVVGPKDDGKPTTLERTSLGDLGDFGQQT